MNYNKVLQGILDIGEEMMVAGAEVSRVEDSIFRMCEGYGATRVNVFIITNNMQATMEAPDGEICTHIRRVVRQETNFDRLDYLNNLSRRICKEAPEPEKIQEYLEEVLKRPKASSLVRLLGSVLIAGGFAAFFGGDIMDICSALIVGGVIFLVKEILSLKESNNLVLSFVSSLAASITAILLVRFGIGNNQGIIMIAGIMVLIPGVAMTNAIRDMLIGDIATGLMRFASSILVTTAIASGFALGIILLGGAI